MATPENTYPPQPPEAAEAQEGLTSPPEPAGEGVHPGQDPLASAGPSRRIENEEAHTGGPIEVPAEFAPLLADAGESLPDASREPVPVEDQYQRPAPASAPVLSTDYGTATLSAQDDEPVDATQLQNRTGRAFHDYVPASDAASEVG